MSGKKILTRFRGAFITARLMSAKHFVANRTPKSDFTLDNLHGTM